MWLLKHQNAGKNVGKCGKHVGKCGENVEKMNFDAFVLVRKRACGMVFSQQIVAVCISLQLRLKFNDTSNFDKQDDVYILLSRHLKYRC